AVSRLSGKNLALDGDLIRYDSDLPGNTELAVYTLASRVNMSKQAIRQSLRKGDSAEFAETDLYHRIFTLADQQAGKRQPRAILPGIQLKSPKITRNLTTAWFAKRVDDREQRCVRQMATIR
ncbi:MAG: DUF1615 family protein, partial [Aeromonas sp.]